MKGDSIDELIADINAALAATGQEPAGTTPGQ
jgi:hypothetical protein